MMKLILVAALSFVPSQQAPRTVTAPAAAKGAIAQYYVAYGTTCSAPTPYGLVPMCPMVAPLPLGVSCFCTGNARFGVVTP